uniref:Innexin n=1 Tax=Panagrolaimus sp. ES5 TaxID=591445 RepID=A0AC34GWD4_9BILA
MMLPAVERLVKNLKPKFDDDVIDRLNYAYTSSLFIILILVIGAKQYVGEPLQCWMSAEYKTNWEKYVENYCFVENTYFVSFDDDKLPKVAEREHYELKYYQWVPLILVLQLLLFLAPKTFWSAVSWKAGLSVKALIGSTSHSDRQKKILSSKNKNDEHSESRATARQMHEVTRFNKRSKNFLFGCIPTTNSYFTSVYLAYKLLNCANTFAQLCMINMFNEKLFIILWFWFVALTILNVFNLAYWFFTTFIDSWKIYFVQAQLNFADVKYTNDVIPEFIHKWITMDGITAIRLISANCGDLISSDIVAAMFHDFVKDQEKTAKERSSKKPLPKDNDDSDLLDPVVGGHGGAPELPKKGSNLLDPFRPGNPGTQKVHPSIPQTPHAPMEEAPPLARAAARPGPPGMGKLGAAPVYPHLPFEDIRPIVKHNHDDVASVD